MSRRLIPLAAALALGALAPSAAAAQAALALSGMPGPAELKATYHLLLRSTWPQEQAANGCRNGGAETIEGTLARGADGSYSGVLARRTELLFCGVHGSRGAEQAPGASVPALRPRARGSRHRGDERRGDGRRVEPERPLGAGDVEAGRGSRGRGVGRVRGGIPGCRARDVSLGAARGRVPAYRRGDGTAHRAAGRVCVGGRAGLGRLSGAPRPVARAPP